MSIIDKMKKAITGGDWFVAFRDKESEEWKIAKMPENQWCADPFVFEDGGKHYIFVEQYLKEKDKGCIGYFTFENGEPVNRGIIIENSYHMSYPDVFCYNNHYYMIPETSANGTVDLYTADHFPDRWHKEKTLINGKKLVDSTVWQDGEDYFLISYSMTGGYEIQVYTLNMEKQELRLLSTKQYEKNTARPGGRLFTENGKLMRPAQDCSRKYGEELIIYQVDEINRAGEFMEHEVKRITADSLQLSNNPERIHQLTCDSRYEVADVYKEKLDFLHAPRILLRSRRK